MRIYFDTQSVEDYRRFQAMLSYKQNQQLAAESQQVALGIGGQT